jgi:hypothetical protein
LEAARRAASLSALRVLVVFFFLSGEEGAMTRCATPTKQKSGAALFASAAPLCLSPGRRRSRLWRDRLLNNLYWAGAGEGAAFGPGALDALTAAADVDPGGAAGT